MIMTETGGSFGGKNRINIEAHTALLAMRTGRPVRLTINRGGRTSGTAGPVRGCWGAIENGSAQGRDADRR